MDALEFIKEVDGERGEGWTEDAGLLAHKLEEYAAHQLGTAKQELQQVQVYLKQATLIIRRLANVLEMGGESSGPLEAADEWLLKE